MLRWATGGGAVIAGRLSRAPYHAVVRRPGPGCRQKSTFFSRTTVSRRRRRLSRENGARSTSHCFARARFVRSLSRVRRPVGRPPCAAERHKSLTGRHAAGRHTVFAQVRGRRVHLQVRERERFDFVLFSNFIFRPPPDVNRVYSVAGT